MFSQLLTAYRAVSRTIAPEFIPVNIVCALPVSPLLDSILDRAYVGKRMGQITWTVLIEGILLTKIGA